MRRPGVLDLAPDRLAVLVAIARHERKILPFRSRHLKTWNDEKHVLPDLVSQNLVGWKYGSDQDGGRTYHLTPAGWAIVGDPPLWLCHPATKETTHG